MENATVRSLRLDVPGWPGHLAGQHVDLRLTAEDGYQAQRSYSIASAPGDGARLDLTVERVEGGEVSPFLHDEVIVGDRFEVRGPIGGYFVWDGSVAGPLLLVAGWSGAILIAAPTAKSTGQRRIARTMSTARTRWTLRNPSSVATGM